MVESDWFQVACTERTLMQVRSVELVNCWMLLSMMWETECPTLGDGSSGFGIGGEGGGALEVAVIGVACIPPER